MDQRETGDWIKIAKLRRAPGYACAPVLERLQDRVPSALLVTQVAFKTAPPCRREKGQIA